MHKIKQIIPLKVIILTIMDKVQILNALSAKNQGMLPLIVLIR